MNAPRTLLFVILYGNQRILDLPGVLCWLPVYCSHVPFSSHTLTTSCISHFFFVRNIFASRGSTVGIVTRLWVGRPGFRTHFSVLQNVQTSCEDHRASCSVGTGRGVKRPGREANCTPPSSAGIKNEWHCMCTPACLSGVDRGGLTFTFPQLFSSMCVKFCGRYTLGICEFHEIGGGGGGGGGGCTFLVVVNLIISTRVL